MAVMMPHIVDRDGNEIRGFVALREAVHRMNAAPEMYPQVHTTPEMEAAWPGHLRRKDPLMLHWSAACAAGGCYEAMCSGRRRANGDPTGELVRCECPCHDKGGE